VDWGSGAWIGEQESKVLSRGREVRKGRGALSFYFGQESKQNL